MKNLKIQIKLLLGFAALLIFMLGIALYALTGIDTIFSTSDNAISIIPAQNGIVEIQYHATKGHLFFEELMSGDGSESMDGIYAMWNGSIEYATVLLEGGVKDNKTYVTVKDSMLREYLTLTRYALVDMVNLGEERLQNKRLGVRVGAGTELDSLFDISYERLMTYCEEGKKITTANINQSYSNLQSTYKASRTNLIIAAGIVVVLGLLFSLFTAKAIADPVKLAAKIIRQEGINTKFELKRTDEVGQLTGAMDSFLMSFRMILREVADASTAVSTASKQISVSTEAMARSAQDQMGQTAGVTAAIEEMSKTTYEIAHNIGNAKEMAIHAQGSADKGSQVIDETVDGMNKMLTMAQQSSNTMNSLSESSRKISKVLNIIEDITKQVNLIALNASIEASRAGEKGKGFAVVADEIKKLAERTAHSTTEISDIINKIQANVHDGVNLMTRSNEEASSGIKLAQEAKISLKEISDAFKNVTMTVSQVAVASQEQSVTGDQITENVKIINTATQQIAAGIQQIAKSSEYLNNLTGNLQKSIKRFKINA